MREVFAFDQGTPEWFSVRAGIPTASMYSTVMAKGRGNAESKTRRTYLLKLAGERLTGEPMDNYSNHHMERGTVMEPEARAAYAFMQDVEPQQIGFIRFGDTGASPDSLICDKGLLEIKTKLPHLQLDVLVRDEVPPEHMPQIQGQLWVADREWCDFVSYWPNLPIFVRRVYRDEKAIKEIAAAVSAFNDELHELVARFSNQEAA